MEKINNEIEPVYFKSFRKEIGERLDWERKRAIEDFLKQLGVGSYLPSTLSEPNHLLNNKR